MSSPLAAPEPWDFISAAYAAEALPQMEQFARTALERAELHAGARVVDVASGPGTLSRVAARAGHHVTALDFSPLMLEQLRARVNAEHLTANVEAVEGDGQRLTFADASFDAGFSLFGLMFFPDRGAGFRELLRVVRPGARVVVSSWAPPSRFPLMTVASDVMAELLPRRPGQKPTEPPLSEPAACVREMTAAGFADVSVEEVVAESRFASVAEYWASMARTSVPIALCKETLGDEAFDDLSRDVVERLETSFGVGPQVVAMTANLIVGRRPA